MVDEELVLVREILVGMDGKDIQTLNLNKVLVAVVVVLVEMVVTQQVQLMDPLHIHIQTIHLLVIHSGMDMLATVDLVEMSLCLNLLI